MGGVLKVGARGVRYPKVGECRVGWEALGGS